MDPKNLARGRLPRVIVVEDEPDTLAFLRRMVAAMDLDAVAAASCAQARVAASAGPFEILCCDVALPDGNGIDLAEELRSQYGCAVVIMSGFSCPTSSLPAGVDDWLVKPVLMPSLKQALQKILAAP